MFSVASDRVKVNEIYLSINLTLLKGGLIFFFSSESRRKYPSLPKITLKTNSFVFGQNVLFCNKKGSFGHTKTQLLKLSDRSIVSLSTRTPETVRSYYFS